MNILADTGNTDAVTKFVFVLKAQILRTLKQTTELLVTVHTHVEYSVPLL